MTTAPTTTLNGHRTPLRLRLKPDTQPTGSVDGGWWPRSLNLSTELPPLVAALAARLGPVERIGYNLTGWDPAPRKIDHNGTTIRLAGYRSQPTHTIDVLSAMQRVTLLVVPPDTPLDSAHHALMSAGHRGDTSSITELLTNP